jgi:hypothetical protein
MPSLVALLDTAYAGRRIAFVIPRQQLDVVARDVAAMHLDRKVGAASTRSPAQAKVPAVGLITPIVIVPPFWPQAGVAATSATVDSIGCRRVIAIGMTSFSS